MRLSHLAAAALASVVALPVSSALADTASASASKASANTLSLGNPLGDLITALMSLDLQRAVTVPNIRQHLNGCSAPATG